MDDWFNNLCATLRRDDNHSIADARGYIETYKQDRQMLFCPIPPLPVDMREAIAWVRKHKPKMSCDDGFYVTVEQLYTWWTPQDALVIWLNAPKSFVCSLM